MSSVLKFDIVGDNKNILSALNGTKAGIRSTVQTAEQAGIDMDAIFRKIGSAAATIGLGFSATQLIRDVVRVRGEIESLQKSFDILAGSKGGELFEEIKDFAVKTPMGMQELAKGAQTLMAFNTEAEEVMPILKTMGDISMGNKEKFQSLILAFSQMRSAGKLMGQDLMQMINAGFNPLSVMSEKTGKSIAQLKEDMSRGAISADMVTQAFRDATSEGGKFNGMLESMSTGVEGSISNLEGAFEDMLNAIGEKSQGIITGTLSIANKLVENYEKVGEAIGLIVTAYGSYKAALMIGTAYKKAEIKVIQQAALEKALDTGATVAMSNAEYIAAARTKLLTMSTMELVGALKAKAVALMSNPYVLTAVAVTGLVAGIYALTTAKTAEEKAIERVNEAREESIKKREEEKNEVNNLLGVIRDETQTRTAQVRAYNKLQGIVPEFTKEMTLEAIQTMNAADQQKRLNELLEAAEYAKAEKGLREYNEMLLEISNAEGQLFNVSDKTKAFLKEKLGIKWRDLRFDEMFAYLEEGKKGFEKTIKEWNDAKNAIEPLDVKIQAAENIQKQAQDAYDAALKAYENEKKKYQDLFKISVANWDEVLPEWVVRALHETEEALAGANSSLQNLKGTNAEPVKNKAYWEQIKKAAQENIDKMSSSSAGSADWEAQRKIIEQAERELAKYGTKRVDNQKKVNEELVSLTKKNEQDKRALIEDENERVILDYQDRLDEIDALEKEWRQKQGGAITAEQQHELDESRNIALQNKNKQLAELDEQSKDEIAKNRETYEQLLKDYGNYEERKEAIRKEYEKLIADARDAMAKDPENTETYSRAIKVYEDKLNKELASLFISSKDVTSSIADLFSDYSKKSVEELQSIVDTGNNVMQLLQGETFDSTLGSVLGIDEDTWKRLKESPESLEAITNAVDGLKERIETIKSPFENIREGLDKIFSAGGDKNKTIEGLRVLKDGLDNVNSAVGFVQSSLSTLSESLDSEALKGMADALGSAMNVVNQTMSGAQAGAAFGPIGAAIGGAIGLATSLVSEISKAHDKSKQKDIENTQDKVDALSKSYENLNEAIESTYGSDKVQKLKDMNVNLERQNQLINEQIQAENEKKSSDESTIKSYNEQMGDNLKKMEENKEAMEEAIFGSGIQSAIEEFANAYADAVSNNMDLNESAKEQATKAMREMVQQSIKEYIAGSGKMEKIRAKMQALYADGVFSAADQKAIIAEYDELNKELDEKFAWAEELLNEDTTTSQPEKSNRGIATASQESVDENNGRLMSLQLSMEGIKEQMVGVVMNLAAITSASVEGNSILSDIRMLHVQSNGFLEDLVKYTKPLNDKIGEVVEQIKKLS